jgi:hypothetical protein
MRLSAGADEHAERHARRAAEQPESRVRQVAAFLKVPLESE